MHSWDMLFMPSSYVCLQVGSIVITGAGAVLLMGGPYPTWTFFAGGTAVFMGTIVLEGVSMSLVSKVSTSLCIVQRLPGTGRMSCAKRLCARPISLSGAWVQISGQIFNMNMCISLSWLSNSA